MTSSHAELTMSTAASLEGLDQVTGAFDEFSSTHGIPDAARRAIQIVLDELLSNTARYGKVDGREPMVDVGFRIDGGLSRSRSWTTESPSTRSGGRSRTRPSHRKSGPSVASGDAGDEARRRDPLRKGGQPDRVRFGRRLDP